MNEQEINSVSSLEPFKRYQYFIKRIADSEKIFTLNSKDNDWAISEVDNNRLYPLWPASEYAVRCASGEWADFKIVEFELNIFLDKILRQIIEEGFLLNVFPFDDKTGFVVDHTEFTRDLNEELEKYE